MVMGGGEKASRANMTGTCNGGKWSQNRAIDSLCVLGPVGVEPCRTGMNPYVLGRHLAVKLPIATVFRVLIVSTLAYN